MSKRGLGQSSKKLRSEHINLIYIWSGNNTARANQHESPCTLLIIYLSKIFFNLTKILDFSVLLLLLTRLKLLIRTNCLYQIHIEWIFLSVSLNTP